MRGVVEDILGDRRANGLPIVGGGSEVNAFRYARTSVPGAPMPISTDGGILAVSPDGQRFLMDARGEEGLAPIIVIQNWRP